MTYYPVLIPTLNRFEHLKECVESLSKCTHANKTELVIGLDYPPSEKYFNGWKEIKTYIDTIKGFKKITIFKHKENLGPTKNTNFLREYAFSHYDAYIFSEDDNTFAQNFLDYMNKCLKKYKDDKDVYYICGCLEPEMKNIISDELEKTNNTIVKVIGNISAYGIGMWKDKELKLHEVFPTDFKKYIFSSRKNIIKLLKCPAKLNHIYFWIKWKPQLNCLCDFTRNAWGVLYNQINILPTVSLVRNNGYDGSGENCNYSTEETDIWNKMTISQYNEYTIIDNINNEDIQRVSKKIFNVTDKEELKQIIPIVIIYLILGYHITQFIISTKDKTKAYLKSTTLWKAVKRIIKR